MPVYKGRRPGTWRVTVWARGRQHETIVTGSKSYASSFEARERLRLGSARVDPTRSAPTFFDFSEALYRPWAETHLADSTWRLVRTYQVATLAEHLGGIPLDVLSSTDLDAYALERRKTVSPSAVNNELRVLRAMLNWARARRIPVAPLVVQLLPTKGQRRVHCWTRPEVLRVFEACRTVAPELLPMVVFMVNTGVRKGEALACEWSWIDRGARMLRIPVTAEWSPKSRKPREIPLSRAALASLAVPRRHEVYVFPSTLGTRYGAFPKEAWWKVIAAAQVKGGPHTTRHTFASHFLAEVPDLQLLARVLGHSSVRTTELYSHLLPGHLAAARNAVDFSPRKKTLATSGRARK